MLERLSNALTAVRNLPASLTQRSAPVGRDDIFQVLNVGGGNTIVGVHVTVSNALTVPAIFGAVNLLAGTLAAMPLRHVNADEKAAGQSGTHDGPLNDILSRAPNPEQSAFDAWFFVLSQLFGHGRGLFHIERKKNGTPVNLWPLETCWCFVSRRGGRKIYTYAPPGAPRQEFIASDIIDLPFLLGDDGFSHVSPILKNSETIALMMAVTRFGARHFENGGVPPFVITGDFTTPGGLDRASGDIDRAVLAAAQAGRVAITLPKGLDVKSLGSDTERSQLVPVKAFNISEVSRIYDIPPVFLHELSKAAAINVEHLGIQLVRRLTRWVQQIEGEVTLKLFGRRGKNSVKYDMEMMMRGEFAARMEGLAKAVTGGVMTPNEARQANDLAPRPEGDELFIQGATVPMRIQGNAAPGKTGNNLEGQNDE